MKNPEGIRLRAMKRIALLTAIAAMCTWSTALGFSVSFTPDTLDFGEVPVGRTDSLTFTLTNTGTDSLKELLSAREAWLYTVSLEPATISLATGESVVVTMRINVLIGNLRLLSRVFLMRSGYPSLDLLGPTFKITSVSSGLDWWPPQFTRSLHEQDMTVTGDRVAGIQQAQLKIEPDNGIFLRRSSVSSDSLVIGVSVEPSASEGMYKLIFDSDGVTADSLHIQVLKSHPRILPHGIAPLADTLRFSSQKNLDTLTVPGIDFWPGCRFEFEDPGLTVISTELFADTLALLAVRLEPITSLDSSRLLAINPDSGNSAIPRTVYLSTGALSLEPEPTPPGSSLSRAFSLGANVPNPFNPSTTITYHVPEGAPEHVSLKVYNLRGQLVATLVDSPRPPGEYGVTWDGTDNNGCGLPSGVYFYRMNAGPFHSTRKMVLLK